MDPELKVAFEALTHDASTWDGVGETLSRARADIDAIDVYRGAFSFAGLDHIDVLVTDVAPPSALAEALGEADAEVWVA